MTQKSLVSATIIAIVVAVFQGTCSFISSAPPERTTEQLQDEMIGATLEWARLKKFPKEAEDFIIMSKGGMFTRSFYGSFTLEKILLEEWIKESAGLQDAKTTSLDADRIEYSIKPGGGASSAEVIINEKTGKVEFKAIWS